MCVYACKNNKGMSLVDFGISFFSFLLFHDTAVWKQQYGLLSRARLILQWLIKVRHHYWFIKGEKNAQCIQTNWWCPFECQSGLPHNRINAWIWSERTNTRWTLIKNPSGKDFNEILHKVNKWRCRARHKNGLYRLLSVVINKNTSQLKVCFVRYSLFVGDHCNMNNISYFHCYYYIIRCNYLRSCTDNFKLLW